jgi:hypothetical protein
VATTTIEECLHSLVRSSPDLLNKSIEEIYSTYILVRYYSELVDARNIMNLVKISKCVVDVKARGTLYVDIL